MLRVCAASMDSLATCVGGVEGGVPGAVAGVARVEGRVNGAVDAFVETADLKPEVLGVVLLIFVSVMKERRWDYLSRVARGSRYGGPNVSSASRYYPTHSCHWRQ